MPSRNTVKEYAPDQYYHVYNRGVEKRPIFLDEQDYTVFLGLLKKYLDGQNHNHNNRHAFKKLDAEVHLLAYCLMPNHFHLLFYQASAEGITKLMRRVSTGYVMYFNNRYERVGGLFQGKFKGSLVNADAYLHHISRYIHLNPKDYYHWPYSSLGYYMGRQEAPGWLRADYVLALFDNQPGKYMEFLSDYTETRDELQSLKWQLANNVDDDTA